MIELTVSAVSAMVANLEPVPASRCRGQKRDKESLAKARKSKMGVHESNRGLCAALRRMFSELRCAGELGQSSEERVQTPNMPTTKADRAAHQLRLDQCLRIAERFRARQCTEPLN